MLHSSLYEKSSYLNKNIKILKNKEIIEYDLKSANISVCKKFKLLPRETIEKLEGMSKDIMKKEIGLLQRHDKSFKKAFQESMREIRKEFFDVNNIIDKDVLSIKNDAIFCLRRVQHTKFDECEFVTKNIYSAYMYVNKLELYYKVNPLRLSDLHVKGISDDVMPLHDDYMGHFLKKVFKLSLLSDNKDLYAYISRFIYKYKVGELPVEYYREFNANSIYRIHKSDITFDDAMFIPYENKTQIVNKEYNFLFILELLKILI